MRSLRLSTHTVVPLLAALVAVAASMAIAFSAPPLNSGDEAAHLDYIVEVWHGHLPVFQNGLTIRPPFGSIPGVQWVSQHPPLFYAALAPVVGPLWDAGHPYAAVLAGRAMNAVIAGLTVLATAWAVRRLVPGRREVASTAAVIVALTSMLLLVGGSLYNDLTNVLFGALALGIAAAALRTGITTRLVISAALVTAGGMLSRLTFAVFLAAVVVAFVCALGLRRGPGWNSWTGRSIAAFIAVFVPLASSAWFYLRNVQSSGNIAGSHPEWAAEHLFRKPITFHDTVFGRTFWSGLFSVFRGHVQDPWGWTWAILLVPLVLGLVVFVVRAFARTTGRVPDGAATRTTTVLVVLMLAAVFLFVLVLQVRFFMQGGAANTRYGLPLIPILAIPMAVGLTALRRWGAPVAISVWMAAAGAVWFRILELSEPAYSSEGALLVARVAATAGVALLVAVLVVTWADAGRLRVASDEHLRVRRARKAHQVD